MSKNDSNIRDHCVTSDHRMRVASSQNLESIYIQNNKPLLNIDQGAVPLDI